jgi:hypothetical protein
MGTITSDHQPKNNAYIFLREHMAKSYALVLLAEAFAVMAPYWLINR